MKPHRESFSFTPEQGVPPAVAPFSHVTRWGTLLFVTGQMPTDPATGKAGDRAALLAQAEQVRRNLLACLAPFGVDMDDVLMVRVYLTDFTEFEAFNAVYRTWFTGAAAQPHLRRHHRRSPLAPTSRST